MSSDGQGVTRVGRICQEQGESRPKYGRWDIRDTVGPSVFPLDQKYSRKKKKKEKTYIYVCIPEFSKKQNLDLSQTGTYLQSIYIASGIVSNPDLKDKGGWA